MCILEMLAILVSLKCWSPHLTGLVVRARCDNMAVVELINNYRAKDRKLQGMLRELMLVEALGDFRLTARHIPGRNNQVSDILSRSHLEPEHKKRAAEIITEKSLQEIIIDKNWLKCDTDQ